MIAAGLSACSSMISSAQESMAKNLSFAIINSDDLETVKDGAPAYLLMLDSFIEGDPADSGLQVAAAKLYGAYAGIFVKDEQRAKRLTQKAVSPRILILFRHKKRLITPCLPVVCKSQQAVI